MVKLIVLYNHPTDPAAFDKYYEETHIPIAAKIPNVKRFEAGKAIGTPSGNAPPYYYVAELYFDSVQELEASFASEDGQAAVRDTGVFATGGLTIFIADAQQ